MDTSVRDQLAAIDPEFRSLLEEHTQHSQRLESILAKPFPTMDEQQEEARLKKLKLKLKDAMESLAMRHRAAPGSAPNAASSSVRSNSHTAA